MRKALLIVCTIFIVCFSLVTVFINDYISYAQSNIFWGSRGEEVRIVQDKLKRWGYYDGAVDGIYGYRTFLAVRSFQQKNGLKVDGIVGPQTREALGMPVATPASRGGSRSDDVYLLARAITGEARGEPYTGQVAVGAVILNRVRDPRFPNSIASVIYQPGAFTSVADGQINMEPVESCIRAARDALNGWDPTGGALYFWNPARSTSEWIWRLKPTLKIGKHWFAKGPY
ncbi:N-acetylmuramoyl-L-alanine amidase [Alkalithermobacter thermoalcaliphilus JW-YL-7 = DSM 7308]|uniref:Spore cortex-lytic enzyme n=1 Tax=Alkalithermobacter thermoalcaliphilus JW-YL-7 = DSM 7308 TaxID=1121328 RepID=A0A150FMM3_CLOPD|nr:spore cortex-lytic enzyme [[Clostridium] paradoxum JW-YL-7 = DSM 7308]SHL22000.1 N-acetylmuramoyl-L-alanine amidase [[Clostridium] paradoxum JW-YL-7 = DSM 7308]